ncbi:MAG: insulinase family protein [Clostridia bacterium]|jgi:predicted Zn-dependent peptidase|nr:insulinase family protein [Clostridia bacterium]
MALIYRETLPNGLRIVGEKMDNYRSVSVGCWVLAGSVYENLAAGESGVSHFIEHMLFKGTEKRGAAKIAEDIDALGGNMNAFTSKECTCFYVKVIDENLDAAMELLADLVCNSKLDPGDIEREKGVVLEEIAMNEDNPEDLVHENLCTLYYAGERLAQPVLGTQASVSALDRGIIRSYMARRYLPENIVLSAAGNFEAEALRAAAQRYFDFGKIAEGAAEKRAEEPEKMPENGEKQRFRFINKDVEQTHIALAFPGFASEDPSQYPLYMLNNAVGGSMSSRLYQSIREKHGMAYSVYSGPTFFTGSGYFTLYAGTGEKQAEQVLEMMLAEYKKLRDEGVTEEEIARSRRQMKTGFVLGRENTSAHSSALGRSELFRTRFLTDDEILERIDAVTAESVNEILPRVCDFSAMKAVCVGRLGKTEKGLRRILVNS